MIGGPQQLRSDIQTNGRLIGNGREADVFFWNGCAWKVFKSQNITAIEQNFRFLKENAHTNAVPQIFAANNPASCFFPSVGLIKMRYEGGDRCLTLRAFLNRSGQIPPDVRERVLLAIYKARLCLPWNVEYRDFGNPDNIMLQFTGEEGSPLLHPLRAIFIEGGKEVPNTANALELFLDDLSSLLGLRKTLVVEQIRGLRSLPFGKSV